MIGGHGHVVPRPDGMKARCGGPGMCAECSREQAQLNDPINVAEAKLEMWRQGGGITYIASALDALINAVKAQRVSVIGTNVIGTGGEIVSAIPDEVDEGTLSSALWDIAREGHAGNFNPQFVARELLKRFVIQER
ncbi:hypothetical protein HWC80_gp076 [Mycobacterium phage Indlulamithi]|uniref:Uncharacterized protein n=1 Tax=Mycobacterium phage Indlulamithi TaxID=2656582 RepID=A0A649VCV0_9CAUD|nr:hypothetical protein HWC80_gp076 [Mycobacterium phage Indlulamithi]QGJ90136.1 hypothetical protein PBI_INDLULAMITHI_98 [Mycobacterium phage Indlulamithi]